MSKYPAIIPGKAARIDSLFIRYYIYIIIIPEIGSAIRDPKAGLSIPDRMLYSLSAFIL
jgi:hypothetical protein